MIPNEKFSNVPSLQSLLEKTAIQSWSWYHYILLYAIIPFIILIIPSSGFENLFILDICHPTFYSIYLNHFYHQTLSHLSGNLALYLMSITGILFLEKDKIRFRSMLAFLFIALPIIASLLYIGFLGNICTVKNSLNTYGFSAIILGFTGYFIYLLLLSSMPILFTRIEKWYYASSIFKSSLTPVFIVGLNFIIAILVMIIGIVSGMFSHAGSTSLNNGFMHSVGFVTGIFFPMIFELKKVAVLDNFHKTLLFHFEGLIIFLTLYLSFVYLTWIV